MRYAKWFGLAALAAASACASARGTPRVRAELDEVFRIRAGESAQVGRDGLRLRFLRVTEDSRCPINARCVRAGSATLAVELRTRGNAPAEAVVQTPDDPKNAAYGPYVVQVMELQPGREIGAPTPRFEAAFRVSRR